MIRASDPPIYETRRELFQLKFSTMILALLDERALIRSGEELATEVERGVYVQVDFDDPA